MAKRNARPPGFPFQVRPRTIPSHFGLPLQSLARLRKHKPYLAKLSHTLIHPKPLFAIILLVASSMHSVAQEDGKHITTTDSAQVVAAIDNFVKVFSNLQWQEF